MRELFIYWRTPTSTVGQAIEAANDWQVWLCGQHPGLRAALYRRADADVSATRTLMEVYAGAIDATVERHIVEEGARALAAWLEGPRHVEVFERCGTP